MAPEAARQHAGEPAVEPIRVFVVDHHELFRSGLCELFALRGFDVVGDAADAQVACARIPALAPHVVVMDLDLPNRSGIEATRRLASAAPRSRVIGFAVSADESTVVESIAAGACGYLMKTSPAEELIDAVRAAAAGESPVSPKAASVLVARVRAGASSELVPGARHGLTPREVEVLHLLTAGKGNLEIANELYMSPTTAKHHISSILDKLGVENRLQAAVAAVRSNIV